MDEIKKIVELLPSEGINRIAETLCDTFEKIVSPLTATTAGAGVFIQSKFEALNAHQQGLAAKCLYEAKEKVGAKTPNKRTVVKPQVVYEALDNTEQMTDESMRSLWSNLLAREFLEGGVHPEIAKLLAKMTSQDALLLLHIANKEPRNRYILVSENQGGVVQYFCTGKHPVGEFLELCSRVYRRRFQ